MIEAELKKNLVKAYNREADNRNTTYIEEWKRTIRDETVEWFRHNDVTSILDLGSGPGRDSEFFKKKQFEPLCVDLSPEMISRCLQKGLNAKVMSFDQLEFPSKSFDAVWSQNSLLHVPKKNLPDILNRVHSILKEEGVFFLGIYGGEDSEGVWAEDHYEPKRYFSFFSNRSLQEMIKPYFTIEKYHTIEPEVLGSNLSFQYLFLRKKFTL